MASKSQRLLCGAKKNAKPSTYRRLVPQSPKSKPAACRQPTLRGRLLTRSHNARRSPAGAATSVFIVDCPNAPSLQLARVVLPARQWKRLRTNVAWKEADWVDRWTRAVLWSSLPTRPAGKRGVVPFQSERRNFYLLHSAPTRLADGLGLESALGLSSVPAPLVADDFPSATLGFPASVSGLRRSQRAGMLALRAGVSSPAGIPLAVLGYSIVRRSWWPSFHGRCLHVYPQV